MIDANLILVTATPGGRIVANALKTKDASTSSVAFEFEGDAVVSSGPEKLAEVRGTKDLCQRSFVRGNPLHRRQRADRPLDATSRQAFLFHEDDHACEETLKEV